MKNNVVYLHVKKGTNDVFYVGISNNKRRAYSTKGRNKYRHNVVNKYGFDVKIVNSDISREYANVIEKELIEVFGRKQYGGQLTNMTKGGDFVWGDPRAWDKYNAKVKSGEILHPSTGNTWTKERRKKTMASRKTNMAVKFRGVHYYSLREAEKQTGISRYLIRKEGDGQW